MIEVGRNQSLANLTWWKIGGVADYFASPSTVEELQEVCDWATAEGHPVTVLGGGSNVLISDLGIEGLVLDLAKLTGVEVREESGRLQLSVLAGTAKSELVKVFLKRKLAPALFLCGIPGQVGGGVVMNAGVGEAIEPREFCELVDWIEVVRPETPRVRLESNQLHWSYRHSSGWQPGIVARVGLSWQLDPQADIIDKVKMATRARLQKQPLEMPSCGSVFQNPPGKKSGALIEQAGLKGHQIGGAQVSMKHANFIVNQGGATATDVDKLIRHVQKVVLDKFDVHLSPEVKYQGRWSTKV